jgi:hypothetical protein
MAGMSHAVTMKIEGKAWALTRPMKASLSAMNTAWKDDPDDTDTDVNDI